MGSGGVRPSGTVTFLFTDIEGSTERWQRDREAMAVALAVHDELIRSSVERHGGVVFKHTGDGMCAVFVSAPAAVLAAVEAQAGLELPVRMGLHTGEAESREGDYFGPTLNLAARVMDAGHGGQVLASAATAGLVRDHVMVDLGEHRLKGLDGLERIFQVGPRDFPSLRTVRAVVGNLPVELSSFVGRVDDVKSVVEELDEHRLVTLIGVGGTGKTRLSIEAATAVAESFPGGCWMVELAPVNVAEAVPFAFCAGLGMTAPTDGDVMGHVAARLRDKRVLLVVDNCEHLLAAAADAVERIVAGCPQAVVLVTSREPLMIRGERLVPVPSLLPQDAERLFLERARDEAPGLVIDAEQARAITELCERLDGLPLALELAASRVRAFTPVELVVNLEERFRMLVGGRRSRMERHQTMRGTLDWSYDLCSEVEQAVFDRLSAFPAGFDLPAARAVAAGGEVSDFDVADVVPQLVDRSLLQRSIASDGTTRYRMLETMRAYGREHLQHQGLSDVTRERHAHYMARTIAALTLRAIGPDEEQVLHRLSEYLPDSLVALDWCIDHQDWENGLRVAQVANDLIERDTQAMIARLHDAARANGAPTDLLDELAITDKRIYLSEGIEESAERGWREIRAERPIPSDRFVRAPFIQFADGGLADADVDEFLIRVDRWLDAPPMTRAVMDWSVVRSLVGSGHMTRIDGPLSRLSALADDLDSPWWRRGVDELRGTIARIGHDWVGAAHWYGRVIDGGNGELRTWFDLSAAWHLLTARSMRSDEFDTTGSQLLDPWRCFQEQRHDILQWRGSVATALALHRVGHTDLADRFIAWAHGHDPKGFMRNAQFDGLLDIAGLPTTDLVEIDDLETLIDHLSIVADELDRRTNTN
jgi:predicted ATPase